MGQPTQPYYQGEQNQVQAANTFFNSLGGELTGAINYQYQLINDIQQKLHEILNRRIPEKESSQIGGIQEQSIGDMSITLMKEIGKLQNNNAALERIYKHLSEII